MMISIIVAMDDERGIGKDNLIPWHISEDVRRFKRITLGHHLIMGRKTYESIGKPLPGRKSIIITRDKNYKAPGCIVTHSLEDAIRIAEHNGESEAFIIGGGEIYRMALPLVDKFYLTTVHTVSGADTFFPFIDVEQWLIRMSDEYQNDEKNEYPHSYQVLTRK